MKLRRNVLPIDIGLYFDYFKNYGSDISDNAQIRVLLAKGYEDWTHVGNVIFNKRFGERLGDTSLAIRFKSHYKFDELNSIGFEYFRNFGDLHDDTFAVVNKNDHSLGPCWLHKIEGTGLKTEFVVLFGLTRPTEPVTLKWTFSYSF